MIFEIQILAWDVIKPVNGIPTLLITGSPTAVYIYKYDKKKNAQIRFHSKKKMHKFASTQKDYIYHVSQK
jgi:hypothetical protein